MHNDVGRRLEALEGDFAALLQTRFCNRVRAALPQSCPCHLVGGVLRDTALGVEPRDFDLVVAGDGAEVAHLLADHLGGRLIELGDERFAAYRVSGPNFVVDIWGRQEMPLIRDLERRDLTIHSFALDLRSGAVTDPFNGRRDLAGRLLSATTPASFANDPLRVLRLCRFGTVLSGFRIDRRTLTLAMRAAGDLSVVKAERKRVELELALSGRRAERAAELLIELHLYPQLWLGPDSTRDSDRRRNEALVHAFRRLERAADRLSMPVDLYSARMTLLLAFLPDLEDPSRGEELERFRKAGLITNARAQQVAKLLACTTQPRDDKQRRWFLHELGELWPSAACLLEARLTAGSDPRRLAAFTSALAALAASSGPEIFDPPPLLTGNDLKDTLGVAAGAAMGRILAGVRRQQIEGSIATRQQALELARRLAARLARETRR